MSLSLAEIQKEFPNILRSVDGEQLSVLLPPLSIPMGYITQDKNNGRIIYEYYAFHGSLTLISSAEFLSHFKHKRLLGFNDKAGLSTRWLYELKGMIK